MKPTELLYAETHEWVAVSTEGGRKVGTIGITAFAIEQLTDLVHMVLPKVGTKVGAGKEFGEVESVKAVSSLYSPVSGEIVAVNDQLPGRLEKLGDDPYNSGWMIKVALSDEADLNKLMDHAAYQKQCASE
ncbi:Glycine cleavage system H protein [Anatilimnocola aggregata]|uniref:Glycine cleavage system H protein n=1 Tax=Anatilimnocola aggregata TaxID=2528021 RepID=A0A517YC76_9BACT|nr:glycine cleavage system protein GcvH [Anatilimnocola aggregata]QDU27845.1 Glycine cleavage system H protein [Anatilimnocola aggregata]